MSNYSALIFTRDFKPKLSIDGVEFTVKDVTWSEPGGPKSARIAASGSEELLWGLLDLLRCPVELYLRGTARWWGFVSRISLTSKSGFRLTASLDNMSNRVKVTYTAITAGTDTVGEQTETAWVENTYSSDTFGDKEQVLSMSDGGTPEQALAYANRALTELAWPQPERDFGSMSGKLTEPSAEITLSGWYDTLGWQYYSQAAGKESYEDISEGLQPFGDATATTKVAQSFQIASTVGWSADQMMVRVKKEGSPTDNLQVILADGVTGATLASATVAGADVPEHLNWVTVTLSSRVSLAPATYYSVVISRSGANDGTNYYKTDGNEAAGYTRGVFKIWNGSAWVDRSPNMDMLFQVLGVLQTTQQIDDAVTAKGQFFADVFIENASGIYGSPYRDGNTPTLDVVSELLESGTSNGLRLCATVTRDRTLWVREADVMGAADYTIDGKGQVYDAYGSKVEKETPPVGVWLRLVDVIPATANVGMIADPSRVFVTSATYNCTQEQTRWSFLGMRFA